MVLHGDDLRAQSRMLVDKLKQSRLFKEYDTAFQKVAGLPLGITSADRVRVSLTGREDNPRTTFCSLVAQGGHRCQACQTLRQNIEREMGITDSKPQGEKVVFETRTEHEDDEAFIKLPDEFGHKPRTFECFAGLCESLIPIEVDGRLVAFLQTGQVMLNRPTPAQFQSAIEDIEELSSRVSLEKIEKAYFGTPVISSERMGAMVHLLVSFVPQLVELCRKILVQYESREPKIVSYAKSFIRENFDRPLTLARVASEVSASPYHLSHRFKQFTGMTFVEFLARTRVEKVKDLLMDRNKRITEIAYEVGFQSLAPFNRAFKRFEGMSPREYRDLKF